MECGSRHPRCQYMVCGGLLRLERKRSRNDWMCTLSEACIGRNSHRPSGSGHRSCCCTGRAHVGIVLVLVRIRVRIVRRWRCRLEGRLRSEMTLLVWYDLDSRHRGYLIFVIVKLVHSYSLPWWCPTAEDSCCHEMALVLCRATAKARSPNPDIIRCVLWLQSRHSASLQRGSWRVLDQHPR